ncbi:unnamed protein product [Candidula unifasciata]|uniref:Ubiquitin-like domain-containing protein n=1 Tax=Candidula unifasciata TaxID=100452 RepID=A0A8S3ZW57_9EUPU|nr:unnamed protein product [Candidula unifasciata]
MAGFQIEQQPIQGWGTGHQGERLFNTAPAYNNGPFPEGPIPESIFGDSEDERNPYDAIYGELDLHRVYGQQLAIWTHKNPDTICLFTPIAGDSFMTIVSYARNSLEFNTAVDKMMVLLPGHKRPLDMEHVFIVKPGTAILIVPLYDYMVTIEVKQLAHKIDMVVNITMSVLELKSRLQAEYGYPIDRMDLLYKDKPLENTRFLFEYGLAHSSTLFVLLKVKNDILVHVETFWGKRYHLYIDSCTTAFGIIASILRRTVSHNAVDIVRLYELFLPKHTLVLYLGSRVIDWDRCLGFYKIESGSVLRMSTIGLAHEMDIRKVPIILDTGDVQKLWVSKFDRWSTVVLKLHGMTGYPVNLMKLVFNDKFAIDFSDTIGSVSKTDTIHLDVEAIKRDDDFLYGIPLKFKIAKGITEVLKVAPSRSIKSVKDTLERIGVPNATMYDFIVDGYSLPNNKRVVDVIDEYKVPIELSLRQYPVFIHGHQNIIYKMLAYSKETLATFLMRVKMKTGLSFQDFLLLSCGTVLDDDERLPVFSTRITIKSSIFLIPRKQFRTFFVLYDDWMTKVRIPAHPKLQQIKDVLWKDRKVPEGGLASIGNFMQWYFTANSKDGTRKQTPLKERMIVYEANIGKKYLQMKVEQPNRSKHNRRLSRYQRGKKQRAVSQPANHPTGQFKLPQIPRYMSADANRMGGHKAYNTRPRHGHRVKGERQTGGLRSIPRPVYKYVEPGDQSGEPEDGEMVLCLRHDYTLKTSDGRRQSHFH